MRFGMDPFQDRPHGGPPPVPPPIAPPVVPQPGAIRGAYRFFKRHPWLSLLATLVLGLATAVVFGMPSEVARGCFVAGLIVLAVCRLLVYQQKRSPVVAPVKTEPAEPKGFWGQFGYGFNAGVGFCFMMVMFHVITSRNREARLPIPPARGGSHAQLTTGHQTEQFWRAAVGALHSLRYDEWDDSNPGALGRWRQRLAQYRSALANAESQRVADVDPDLGAMARRHFQVDHGYLQKQEILIKTVTELAPHAEAQAHLERLTFDQLIDQIKHGLDNGQLSKEAADAWRLPTFRDELDAMFFEIEVMQARLGERYKSEGRRFFLPPGQEKSSRTN